MAKVAGGNDDLLYDGDWLEIRAMRRRSGELPAKAWADGLDKKGKAQLLAAAEILLARRDIEAGDSVATEWLETEGS